MEPDNSQMDPEKIATYIQLRLDPSRFIAGRCPARVANTALICGREVGHPGYHVDVYLGHALLGNDAEYVKEHWKEEIWK